MPLVHSVAGSGDGGIGRKAYGGLRQAANLKQSGAELLDTSKETARKAVMVLEESHILEEITGRSWGKLYVARPIYDAIQT